MAYPESPTHPPGTNLAVVERVHALLQEGALPIDPLFNCASEGQADLLFHGRRWLIGANDEGYKTYTSRLQEAGIPYIANNPEIGDEAVFAGEIPRDARSIPQVSFSKPPRFGMTPRDAFFKAGRGIGLFAKEQGVVPTPDSFSLRKILARRLQADVLFLPPLSFDVATPEAKQRLLDRIHSELWPTYERFGATALLSAFREGIES